MERVTFFRPESYDLDMKLLVLELFPKLSWQGKPASAAKQALPALSVRVAHEASVFLARRN